jgi:cell division septal protein FtsQ
MAYFSKRRRVIYSRHQSVNPLFRQPKIPANQGRKKRILQAFLVLIALGVIYFLFFSPFFQIKTIQVRGQEKINLDQVSEIVRRVFSKKRWSFLPQNNYFLLSRGLVNEKLREEIEKVVGLENYQAHLVFPDQLNIELEESQPLAVLNARDDYYFLDKEGRVIQYLKEDEVGDELLVVEQNRFLLRVPEPVIAPGAVQSLASIKNDLQAIGVEIVNFQTPVVECPEIIPEEPQESDEENENANQNENDNANKNQNLNKNINEAADQCDPREELQKISEIQVVTEAGYLIYFETRHDIQNQVWKLKEVLEGKFKSGTGGLKYIDLRYENRVYYQ